MALDKAIEHKKERRKPYYGSKSIDRSCRNHGGCPWCEGNRKYKYKKKEESIEDALVEYTLSENYNLMEEPNDYAPQQLSWTEHAPSKRDVEGSNPF